MKDLGAIGVFLFYLNQRKMKIINHGNEFMSPIYVDDDLNNRINK